MRDYRDISNIFSSFLIRHHILLYRHSTFFLAQGVRLRKTRLDLMLGFFAKQFILILRDISSHPYFSTRRVRIISRVTPWRGSLCLLPVILYFFYWKYTHLNWRTRVQPIRTISELAVRIVIPVNPSTHFVCSGLTLSLPKGQSTSYIIQNMCPQGKAITWILSGAPDRL